MARSSRSSRGRSSGRGRSEGRSEGRGSRGGRGSSRGGRGSRQDADYTMVGSLTLSKKVADKEEEILDNLADAIDQGLPLTEVLQQSGLQMWLQFWWPEEGSMKFERKDKILISFKEPHEKAPDFNLATASFDTNS